MAKAVRWEEVRKLVAKRWPAFDYLKAGDIRNVALYGDWLTLAQEYLFRPGAKRGEYMSNRYDDTNGLLHYIRHNSVRADLISYFGKSE